MLRAWLRRIVKEEIQNLRGTPPRPRWEGYRPLDEIRGGLFHWVPVPFNGRRVWCELRCLNATQLEACGDLSIVGPDVGQRPTPKQMIDVRNIQEKLADAVLCRPTLEEIFDLVTGEDRVVARMRGELAELQNVDLSPLPADKRKELEGEIERLELFVGYLLPEDTIGFLTSWALGTDVSDVKLLSGEKLVAAASLAARCHDRPSDHISGAFTDRDRADIDRAALLEYDEYLRKARAAKEGKTTWIGGGRGR